MIQLFVASDTSLAIISFQYASPMAEYSNSVFSAKLVFGADQVPINSIGGSRVTDQGLRSVSSSFLIYMEKRNDFLSRQCWAEAPI